MIMSVFNYLSENIVIEWIPFMFFAMMAGLGVKIFCIGWSLIKRIVKYRRQVREHRNTRKLLVILGSGGHTTEIIKLCEQLPLSKNKPFIYVAVDSDHLSFRKVWNMEKKRDPQDHAKHVKFLRVKRIRDVGQSFLTALMFRAPRVFKQTLQIVYEENPSGIICNGPGACVPFGILATLTNMLRLTDTKIVFVESICRVNSLSLSGRIMIRLAHYFFVQWQDLEQYCRDNYPKANVKYLGRLV